MIEEAEQIAFHFMHYACPGRDPSQSLGYLLLRREREEDSEKEETSTPALPQCHFPVVSKPNHQVLIGVCTRVCVGPWETGRKIDGAAATCYYEGVNTQARVWFGKTRLILKDLLRCTKPIIVVTRIPTAACQISPRAPKALRWSQFGGKYDHFCGYAKWVSL